MLVQRPGLAPGSLRGSMLLARRHAGGQGTATTRREATDDQGTAATRSEATDDQGTATTPDATEKVVSSMSCLAGRYADAALRADGASRDKELVRRSEMVQT